MDPAHEVESDCERLLGVGQGISDARHSGTLLNMSTDEEK